MRARRDDEYQDSLATGSLVGALALWQSLLAANRHTQPQQLAFGFVCSSESRARRVAAALLRHRACATARVHPTEGKARADWRIEGTTRQEVQSLPNLEGLFTWLTTAAQDHQVTLHDLAWTESTGTAP